MNCCLYLTFLPLLALFVAYGIAHTILANILGHAILAIAHPDIYLPTLRSAAFAPIYGTPIVVAMLLACLALAVCIRCYIGSDDEGEDEDTPSLHLPIMEISLSIPVGVIINVLGILVLSAHGIRGFYGPLPTLTEAARVGAVGNALLMTTHGWRFKSSLEL
ncbi:hypothetical protein C8R43DRAFT_318201 [Mycena crocata]|nr:hypothetical protein C8R43DRAFT_318201 [Mycena crocata]